MKKLLALLLSVCMLIGMSTNVMAYSDVEEETYVSEAVTVLSNLDILHGYEDGTFKPEATVTRAEMAKIICEMMGYSDLSNTTTIFTDVPKEHWASGYINIANGLGIVCGYGDDTYGPEDTVTYNQAAKMIVCSLGYGVICDTYPSSYLIHASTLRLFTNVNGTGEVAATRGDIASLVYNALDAAMLVQTGYGSGNNKYEVVKDDTLLSTKLEVAKVRAMVNSIDFKENRANITIVNEDNSFEDITSGTYDTEINLAGYKNLACTLYIDVKDDKDPVIVAAVASTQADTVTIANDELFIEYKNNRVKYYEGISNKRARTIDLVKDTEDVAFKAYVNDSSDTVALSDYLGENEVLKPFDSITFIDADSDGKFETAIIEVIESFVVKSVNDRTMTITVDKTVGYSFGKSKLSLDEDEVTYNMDTDISDIEVGDVVNVKTSTNKGDIHYEIYVTNEKIEGYVNAQKDDVYYIDEEPYYLANNVELKLGITGVFTLDMKGNIIAVDTTTTSSAAKWGYVLKTAVDMGMDDEYVIKLVTIDGEEEIYNFATKVKVDDESTVYATDENGDNIYSTSVTKIFDTALDNEALSGKLIAYRLNSKNEISSIYHNFELINKNYETKTPADDLTYKSDGRLGSYYTSSKAYIFNKKADDDEVTVQSSVGLLVDEEYAIDMLVYNTATNDLVVAVGTNVTAAADPSSPVMLVNSIAQSLEDVEIVEGYVDGELVEFTYNTYEMVIDGKSDIEKGDIIQYTLTDDNEAIGIRNLGNVTSSADFYNSGDLSDQDEKLFTHYGQVANIRGVNIQFSDKDNTVSMPGNYPVYRYDPTGNKTYIYTDEFIEDVTMDVNLDEDETNNERLVVVKYDNIPLIAVIVEVE